MTEKSKFIIDAEFIEPPSGVEVKNFVYDGEPLFKSRPRKKKLQHLVLHETAGRTAVQCKQTLLRKKYGVHLILDREGLITCHGDLANDIMTHANQLNSTSIGIEVVNPYAPQLAIGMDVETIAARWWTWCPNKEDRRYVLPTEIQLETLSILIPWLCEKLKIPYQFPTHGLSSRQRKIKGWRKPPLGWRAKPKPGVIAHQDFYKHADGRYLLEHLIGHSRP